MPVICVGINYRTAPVERLEQTAFSDAELTTALSRMVDGSLSDHSIGELAILSTCNRTEIYAAATDVTQRFDTVPDAVIELITSARSLPLEEFAPHLYTHRGIDAVEHLCRVASGLDSMVVGEAEILGQVSKALAVAETAGAAGPVLDAVFHTAVRAGRRARAETAICRNPASVSSEAIRLVHETVSDLNERKVLVVGSGKMGRLAGEGLHSRGVTQLSVISRTREHAEEVARKLDAVPLGWHELCPAIADADIVICSTGAPHAVITDEVVRTALAERGEGRPMVIVDIAVPRDVEPSVRQLPDVRVIDMDDLNNGLSVNLAARRQEVPLVEAVIAEEIANFEEWRRGAVLRPLLSRIRARGDAIRRRELDRLLRRTEELSPELEEKIEHFSRSLVNRLLHDPTLRLRSETDPARSKAYAQAVQALFCLPDNEAEDHAA